MDLKDGSPLLSLAFTFNWPRLVLALLSLSFNDGKRNSSTHGLQKLDKLEVDIDGFI